MSNPKLLYGIIVFLLLCVFALLMGDTDFCKKCLSDCVKDKNLCHSERLKAEIKSAELEYILYINGINYNEYENGNDFPVHRSDSNTNIATKQHDNK